MASAVASSANAVVPPSTMMSGTALAAPYGGEAATTYDLWDPQNWMLDNLIDFNYSYAAATMDGGGA